ncbi:MAG TPA: competence/damage-inducible protein A [Vicinamibacterales bacterium]|jgi:nicotinamide-nucleotide amidase
MKACILAVGSEMLTPFKVDTNSLFITERLNTIGYDVRMKAIVADDIADIARVFEGALTWADVVVITGGLGPTEDDLTREAVAQVLGVPLDLDEQILAGLRERFARRGMAMADNNRKQAMVPRGAIVMENRNGSAPGLLIARGSTDVALFPGPPRELKPMLERFIEDRLAPKAEGRKLYRRTLKITGRPESEVDAIAGPVYSQWTTASVPISTTILAALGQIELHLTASSISEQEAAIALDRAVEELVQVLGPSVYSTDGRPLETVVGDLLRQKKLTIAVAESCSGGLLASRLTDVPGSSDYVERGVVCYSNRAKTEMLGVPEELIKEQGAVSEPVAQAMASGIIRQARSDVGVGITGIAGPGGGTPDKPVGTVVVAVTVDGTSRVRTLQLFGGRDMVKFQSAQAALNMVRLMLQ